MLNRDSLCGGFVLSLVVLGLAVFSGQISAQTGPGALGERTVEMYTVQQYWVRIPPVSGNQFDVDAEVTFSGSDGSSITTPMFYDGQDSQGRAIYRFRFTGTKPAVVYEIETTSPVSALDGHTGEITVVPSSDPDGMGFVQASSSKLAVERGQNGDMTGFLLNIMQTDPGGNGSPYRHLHLSDLADDPEGKTATYAQYAKDRGFTAIYVLLTNHLAELGAFEADDVNDANPDLTAFRILDRVVATAHANGMHIHFWRWGDANRGWTPQNLPGGINGSADRRLTKHLAARLGPMPSWSIGYGFDLHEWVTPGQLENWRDQLINTMGFPHVVSARSYSFGDFQSTMTGYSQGDTELGESASRFPNYQELSSLINGSSNRPHLLEERNTLGRWGADTADTRLLMWRSAMVGGVGGWYGFWETDPVFTNANGYANDVSLLTHARFWEDRFKLDMRQENGLTRGPNDEQYALRSPSTGQIVVFAEDTSRVDLKLNGQSGPLNAVAVDTTKAYAEINLGSLPATNQTWDAPYRSDWAIAIDAETEDCVADLNNDGVLNEADFTALVIAYNSGDPLADINEDGLINSNDLFLWISLFFQGC